MIAKLLREFAALEGSAGPVFTLRQRTAMTRRATELEHAASPAPLSETRTHNSDCAPKAAPAAGGGVDEKTERNRRVQVRWDELRRIGAHGYYETLFQVVHEEVERARTAPTSLPTRKREP